MARGRDNHCDTARTACSRRRSGALAAAARGGGSHSPPRRRGIVCVVAMIFLMLFAILAIGFFAATSISTQLAANENMVHQSQVAAESGMQWVRYQLATTDIPRNCPPEGLLEEALVQFEDRLTGTRNLGARRISYDGCTVSIPDGPGDYLHLGTGGAGFRVTMTQLGERLRVKVIGSHDGEPSRLGRAIEVDYVLVNHPSEVFDYGVASRGQVRFKANANTKLLGTPDGDAGVLATYLGSPAIQTGKGPIDGNLSVVGSKDQVTLGGGSVGGSSDAADIMATEVTVRAAPEFPYVHTSVFRPFATNVYNVSDTLHKNIRVPANAGATFDASDAIEGILYVESPNVVTFSGNVTVRGVIVFENANDPSVNVLTFQGNVTPSAMPDTAEYAALRARAAGLAIAAPTASVVLSGSVDGRIEGSVIAHQLTLSGSADLTVEKGSLISLGEQPTLIEGKTLHVAGNAAGNIPSAGVRLTASFLPDVTTYREVPQ